MSSKNMSVTLGLEGEVDSERLKQAIIGFADLVRELSHEVAQGVEIEWVVEDMSGGSANTTLVGLSSDPAAVERVVRGYAEVGDALEKRKPIPFSRPVQTSADKIRKVVNGKVRCARFATNGDTHFVYSDEQQVAHREETRFSAYGAIEGDVETLTKRANLRFTLYDSLYDRAVSCYPHQGQEGLMLDIWGKRVIVEGWITRDPDTGRPAEIRKITRIDILTVGNYKAGRGALKSQPGDPLPEDLIRRIRDG